MAKKVFIVDDDQITLTMLEKALENFHSCKVQTFTSGESVLEQINDKPDVIVLDYNLSGDGTTMNGIEVLEKLNKDDHADIPVIVLSSQEEDPELVYQFVMKGASHYVVKDQEAITRLKEALSEVFEAA